MRDDPFAALGLRARHDLTDDDVRSAWRRIAAASHPDREDGGDPALFSRAAVAYAELRTADGRGEALAGTGRTATGRVAIGRTAIGRVAIGVAASALAIFIAGWSPASIAILAGALTWLLRPAWRAAWRRARSGR